MAGFQRPKRYCSKPGCNNLVRTGIQYCEQHERERADRVDRERGTATERGYDADWRNLRAAYLAENPLCEHCAAQGRVTAAAEVDHIKPFHAVEDPLRLDWSNLQSLCKTHHSQKTASEKGWGRGV